MTHKYRTFHSKPAHNLSSVISGVAPGGLTGTVAAAWMIVIVKGCEW